MMIEKIHEELKWLELDLCGRIHDNGDDVPDELCAIYQLKEDEWNNRMLEILFDNDIITAEEKVEKISEAYEEGANNE